MAPNIATTFLHIRRQIPTTTNNNNQNLNPTTIRDTFSSWDRCMQKGYCKYPVITILIILSIIALGILWCIIGCLCCGVSCCCGLCSCCRCGGRRHQNRKRHQHQKVPSSSSSSPSPPSYSSASSQQGYGYQGYQPAPQQPPVYQSQSQYQYQQGPVMNSGPAGSGMYQKNEGVVVNEDALPAFPTWSNAPEARVYQHHHGHDSNDLGQQQQQQQQGGGVEMTNLYAHQTQGSDIPVSHPPPAATSYEPNPYAYNINNAGNGNRTGGVADGYHSISTQDLGTGGGGAGYEPYRGTSPAAGAGGARTGRGVGEYIARGGLNGGGSKNKSAWPQTQQQQRQVDQ